MIRGSVLMVGIAALITTFASAQCPPSSSPNVHVVQQGEYPYRIARTYNLNLDTLLRWNNLDQNSKIPVCKELYIVNPATVAPSPDRSIGVLPVAVKPIPSKNIYVKQQGLYHIVQEGQTIEGIAKLYGYTDERFREFNNITPAFRPIVGSVLRSTDCKCEGDSNPVNQTEEPVKIPEPVKSPQPVKTPEPVKIVENPKTPDPVVPVAPAQPTATKPTPPAPPITKPQLAPPTLPPTIVPEAYNYMSADEYEMVKEINLMRKNPPAYIPHVREFLAEYEKIWGAGNMSAAATELISVLQNTLPLSELTPAACLYLTSVNHANQQKPTGDIAHEGLDGKMPWDRGLESCPEMTDVVENLVGGMSNARKSVIFLLIDEGIENRGHRNALINPNWKYVSCHYVGKVGQISNWWIQMFGY